MTAAEEVAVVAAVWRWCLRKQVANIHITYSIPDWNVLICTGMFFALEYSCTCAAFSTPSDFVLIY